RGLARVVKPGGRIGLPNWTRAENGLAALFRIMRPYQPTPPDGVGFPFDWGDEQHVRDLLGESFDLELERDISPFRVPNGQAYWLLFSSSYGPTRTLSETLDDEQRAELERTWI